MTNILDLTEKTISTSATFFHDIWASAYNVCASYSTSGFDYVNDFVNRRSFKTSELSKKERTNIHLNNVEYIRRRRAVLQPITDIEVDSNLHSKNMTICSFETFVKEADSWTPDMYLSNDFLDAYQIPQGHRRQRLHTFHTKSRVVFKYLSYHLGNKRIVNIRRKMINKKFSNMNICGMTMLPSGSKAEGLAMAGSDTDIMCISGTASEIKSNIAKTECVYSSLNSELHPGYCFLENHFSDSPPVLVKSSDLKAMTSAWVNFMKLVPSVTPHGPSMSTSVLGEDMDLVSCLKSTNWPAIAAEWIHRKRQFNWPSKQMIQNIVKQGCHIVPVSSKANESDGAEWRLSFSFAEREIIMSFNHTQFLVYGLLKIVLNEIVKQNQAVSELLCSYFLKTTLFWVIEENHPSLWRPKYFILCFQYCLERLVQFVMEENCPNYFVRANNMFFGRFSTREKEQIMEILCDLSGNGFQWILFSATMRNLEIYLNNPELVQDLAKSEKVNVLTETAELVNDLIRHCKRIMSCVFSMKKYMFKPNLKALLKIPYVKSRTLHHLCHFLVIDKSDMINTMKYSLMKLYMQFLFTGFRADLSSGKAMLATWLYINGKFDECIKVTEALLQSLPYRIIQNGISSSIVWPETNTRIEHLGVNFIEYLHLYSAANVDLVFGSVLTLKEISFAMNRFVSTVHHYSVNNLFDLSVLPGTYCYFLKFLCYLHLRNGKLRDEAFLQMKQVHRSVEPLWPEIGLDRIMQDISFLCLKISANVFKYQNERLQSNLTFETVYLATMESLDEYDLEVVRNMLKNFHSLGAADNYWRDLSAIPQAIFKEPCILQ